MGLAAEIDYCVDPSKIAGLNRARAASFKNGVRKPQNEMTLEAPTRIGDKDDRKTLSALSKSPPRLG